MTVWVNNGGCYSTVPMQTKADSDGGGQTPIPIRSSIRHRRVLAVLAVMSRSFNFWIVAPAQTMGIDNVNVAPTNMAALPPTTRMVQWREGRGELESNDRAGIAHDRSPT